MVLNFLLLEWLLPLHRQELRRQPDRRIRQDQAAVRGVRDPRRPQEGDQVQVQPPVPQRQNGIRRRQVQCHSRGPPRRQFRRTAGDLPQCQGRGGPVRQDQEMLVITFHRPCHRIPREAGILP